MAGGTGAAVTVKETGMVTGLAVPPVSVMVPLWVPTAREPVATLTAMLPLPVPEVGAEPQPGGFHWRSRSRCRRRCC